MPSQPNMSLLILANDAFCFPTERIEIGKI